jgi:hypothetical protein
MVQNEQYAHVLLFACPHCERALVATCTSDSRSLEVAEANWYASACVCGWTGEIPGATAVKHWVEPWHGRRLAQGDPGLCDPEATKEPVRARR